MIRLQPEHATLVGIDSDGCVFPTMEIKQKHCFHPIIIEHWGLQEVADYVRETAEFVNLYSKWRGTNRFIALLKTFDLLRQRTAVRESGVTIPELNSLRQYVRSGKPLSNEALQLEAARGGDHELNCILAWSLAVNAAIEQTVRSVAPFQWARQAIVTMARSSDVIVVSQTPEEALLREWRENKLDSYVKAIAGQELGTKAEQLRMAAAGKYEPGKVLMVGDSLGDRRAAQRADACFFPIKPGAEEVSWRFFCEEAYDRFLAGQYQGEYEERLIAEFQRLLPETPPWED
ncbi:MAG TPA: HAD family hydrolase [Planctomycetaceae bacterium]|nr:HAD family hydrolase [Planctomycetaceae bacterium]